MKYYKKSDIILIFLLIIISFGIWLALQRYSEGKKPIAQIYEGNRLVQTVPLTEGKEKVFQLEGNTHVTFRLNADGSIQFLTSDCPDQICVRTGKLSKVGESAACLPNNLLIKIVPADTSPKDDTPDIIVH